LSTCIITGAAGGIGQAVAKDLSALKLFDNLALIVRDIEAAKGCTAFANEKCAVKLYEYDLAQAADIPALVERINAELGEITCLLNIAGYTNPQPVMTTTLDDFQYTYAVNVFAPFMLIRECVKYMRSLHDAKIINIASTAGITPRPGWISYASSKAAMISISQTLTEELREYGIKVYCVSPGRCATKLRRKLAPNEDPSTIMQPEDVSKVICDLVAEKRCCLDGQNIIVRMQK